MTIEKSSVTKTFMDLVKISSPTFHEGEMADEVLKRLSKIGLNPRIDKEGNVLAFLAGDHTKERYMLNAHMDTVQKVGDVIEPHIDDEGWIRSNGKTILGADNKTAVAAILETVARITKEGVQNNHPLEIVFTVSEESGNHGAHGLDYEALKAKRGYIFDASDRDFGAMIISSPAYLRFDLKVKGKPSHASKPEDAINALPIFAKALLNCPNGRVDERTTVNFGIVSTGEVGGPVNTVPGLVFVSGEVRSMEEKRLKEVSDQIISNFQKEVSVAGGNLESKTTRENGSFEFSPNDTFVTRTQKVLQTIGENPNLIKSWGCYEANIFAEHGIMMLNLADGSLDSHTPDERVKVSDLEKLQEMVYQLVTS